MTPIPGDWTLDLSRNQLQSAARRFALTVGALSLFAAGWTARVAAPPPDAGWILAGLGFSLGVLLAALWFLVVPLLRVAPNEPEKEMSLIFDITRSLNATLELDALLERLGELVGTTLGFEEFAILLPDETDGDLVIRATWGRPLGRIGATLPLDDGPWGEAIHTGHAVFHRTFRDGGRHRVRSSLTIPMMHKGRAIGVLHLSRPVSRGFSPEEIRLLGNIGGQAALAIANAHLFQRMVALSITDPLTGVFNRRHLHSQLEIELSRAERSGEEVTVIMIDLDHFKHLNDTCGHTVGDEVLREVARLLRNQVRRMDTVARFGGEEFAIVLPRLRRAEAVEVAEKLRLAVRDHDFDGGRSQPSGRVTLSLGTATYPHDGGDLYQLLNAADSALYTSKRSGRDCTTAYLRGMELHENRKRQITEEGFRPSA